MSSTKRGVLQTLTNFFFTRKRKHLEYEKDSPVIKCIKTHSKSNDKTNYLQALPREILWTVFENLDLKSLIRTTMTSERLKLEVAGFLASFKQIPYLAKHLGVLNYHEKCCFMSKLFDIFLTRFASDRVNLTVKWFTLAYEYRTRIPLSIAFTTLMHNYAFLHCEKIFDALYSLWFETDVSCYIMLRSKGRFSPRLEKNIFQNFTSVFYNRRTARLERAVVVSMFLRKISDPRKRFYLAQLLFGPRNLSDGRTSLIDFEMLEDGDGEGLQAFNELDGFPEFFQMLVELRGRGANSKHRWSRSEIFLILEDVTTQPLWSMLNFARLLLMCPYLAINTTVIRCRNSLYEDAAFVLYHLLLLCESHNTSLNLLLPIMKDLDRALATWLRDATIECATNDSTASKKKCLQAMEMIEEAFDRVFRPISRRNS
ncbi:unnamed protein product [Bursaphelenchus okinawaensis]|uniref:F-box domain-containing protein n=1 Tax=Bursaphelenchus okinawaensis TaxID=465554 RepID=A0A811KHV4_9BILA|nr:unnamed protein product [Bursaphelenchus okinawaensis]CAG9103185.1 unnamed protein product [Bursaphelenchus okinawaensis]